MEQLGITNQLGMFGLTRQEATIYVCLLQNTELTGYEAAKLTGISRSNVYSALAGLVEKGAAYRLDGVASKYVSVPIGDFCDNKIRDMMRVAAFLEDGIPDMTEAADGYITIIGYQHILNKIYHMMQGAEQRIYISASEGFLRVIWEELGIICQKGIKVVIVTDHDLQLEGAIVYLNRKKEKQLRFITDSKYVLTGDVTGSAADTCLYSGQKNFVNVFKEALSNEIKLIELTKGEDGNE